MIEQNIRNFNKQLEWEPEIVQGSILDLQKGRTLVLGMGGSHLGADLLKAYDPRLDLVIHSDYGLPTEFQGLALKYDSQALIIASSYSGNTEEVVDGLNLALEKGLKVAVMASGGKLIEIAKEKSLPYILLPTGLQPRMSAGYQVRSLAKLIGREDILEELNSLARKLNPSEFEERGKELAEKISGKIPVIYSSQANKALAYIWKVKLNETAKVPAFYNIFPEANHNEISGFVFETPDPQDSTLDPQKGRIFIFILLKDSQDHPKIQKRMEVFSKLFSEKSFSVEQIALTGEGRLYLLFANLLLADWTSFYFAKQIGVDPEVVPLIEGFKANCKR